MAVATTRQGLDATHLLHLRTPTIRPTDLPHQPQRQHHHPPMEQTRQQPASQQPGMAKKRTPKHSTPELELKARVIRRLFSETPVPSWEDRGSRAAWDHGYLALMYDWIFLDPRPDSELLKAAGGANTGLVVHTRYRMRRGCPIPFGSRRTIYPDFIMDGRFARRYHNGTLHEDLPIHGIAVEYDGAYWHAGTTVNDARKTRWMLNEGYAVLRIRETPLPTLALWDDLPTDNLCCLSFDPATGDWNTLLDGMWDWIYR